MTGWNLPPGVTDRMIDEAAGAFDDDKSALASEEEEAAEAWEYWHQRSIKFEAALLRLRQRDDRNGSLPQAYREIIDAALMDDLRGVKP